MCRLLRGEWSTGQAALIVVGTDGFQQVQCCLMLDTGGKHFKRHLVRKPACGTQQNGFLFMLRSSIDVFAIYLEYIDR